MLIDYEQLPEEGADLLAGSGGDSSSSPSGGSGGLPGIDVETDAGADDAGPGADDSGAPVCDPATYVADDSCGVGYCRSANQPSTCSAGVEQSCLPGAPLGPSDATCDGVDDDCSGGADEDYVSTVTSCGVGACAASGLLSCQGGAEVDSCATGAPLGPSDATCDGVDDDCSGGADEDYVSTVTSCGVGACAASGLLSCQGGVEVDSCATGAPIGPSDATCDGVDDDCSGGADEDYASTVTSCGVGACAASGLLSCQGGVEVDSCTPGVPLPTDTAASGIGVDDDCDGPADEDEPCDVTPQIFTAGSYPALAIPLNCTSVTVQLWGGAGAGGELEGVLFQPGGRGGAGGYAESTLTLVTGEQLDLMVGAGASAGCNAGGVSALPGFGGGSGGPGVGADGEDALQSGGGSGATPSSASAGGRGYRGGGGGGAGSPLIGLAGKAGGGGAASAFFVAGSPVVIAGGGGGGGGAASLILGLLGVAGGDGGTGCGGAGSVANQNGGGGGGGGACVGGLVQAGANDVPHDAASLPANQARGGQSSCGRGGDGYAIVTFGS